MRRLLVAVMFLVSIAGCSGKPSEGGGHQAKRPGGSAGHGGGHGGGPGDSGARGGEPTSAVPVEVALVMRRSISSFI